MDPTQEEIEAVARAIYEAPAYRDLTGHERLWDLTRPSHTEYDRNQYRIQARAAIEAMRNLPVHVVGNDVEGYRASHESVGAR